jgi:hypothetical protein
LNILELIASKDLKAKEKAETLSAWLLNSNVSSDELTEIAATLKDPAKAICIEALEFATKQNPAIASEGCFDFVTKSLLSKAPRVKWESARVIGNIAHLFCNKLDDAVKNLLANSEHEGTVVRWSSAIALSEILKLKPKHYKDLMEAMEAISNREEKNSIKKIYIDAIKKQKKNM